MRAKREWHSKQDRIRVFQFEAPCFEFNWHYHDAFELTWIKQGEGLRYVGDVVQPFQRNDMVLIRSGVPHTWHSDPKSGKVVSALVIHFSELLLQPFRLFPEWNSMRLLVESGVGMQFHLTPEIRRILCRIEHREPAQQLVDFFALFQAFGKADPVVLSSSVYRDDQVPMEQRRIALVLQYIHQHAANSITLHDLCGIVGLSPGAFCRFFKRQTQQTPMEYVLEWRLRRAAQYLLETDESVGVIAGFVGFNSQAYFTRMFVEHFGCTPLVFRKRH